jgi:hypothetical protein
MAVTRTRDAIERFKDITAGAISEEEFTALGNFLKGNMTGEDEAVLMIVAERQHIPYEVTS